jgi:phytoene dehydrogenase-like protein
MAGHPRYDAVIVGAGPNGLAAAIVLAQAGRSVLLLEAAASVGGGTRSAQLTLPGFVHDVCSAIHPLSLSSPFLRRLPLAHYGLEWVMPPAALAHPLDDGPPVMVERSVAATASRLGPDERRYAALLQPIVDHWLALAEDLLGPFPFPPKHPLLLARFGLNGLWPADWLQRLRFRGPRAAAVFGGMTAHAMLAFHEPLTAAIGLTLAASAHAVGWPLARGGSQAIADALAAHVRALGGEIVTGQTVRTMAGLPPARHYLFDVTPRQLARIAADRLPAGYRRQLENFRYGPGVFKLDWALDGPVPWKSAEVARSATVHLGGRYAEIAAAEAAVARGQHPERPFVLLAQSSLFDDTRAPRGQHTLWAYCHVPNGSTVDMSARIEAQVERFAPGFRQRILARSAYNAPAMEAYNPNYIGGDINGGRQDWRQFWTRPVARVVPYATPNPAIFMCSSSTPPGGGVHGMCGFYAAQAVLRAGRAG